MTIGCGHGHVYPEPNGMRARCGGPGVCALCSADLARKNAPQGAVTWVSSLDDMPHYFTLPEWQPTPELRWIPPGGRRGAVLQQRWTLGGRCEWRDVPTAAA